jgi:Cys-tRNA(Pro)/Cys-tRNA(Cys) deacylase
MARRNAAGTPAMAALERAGLSYTVHSYEHDPTTTSYGSEAAQALGLDPEQVFKTLLVEADGELVVGVVPVAAHLDLKALATALGAKRAAMADPSVAARVTGYVVGGISPIGQKRALRTVLDESARALEVLYVSGGRRGLDLGLAPSALAATTGATFAQISRSRP